MIRKTRYEVKEHAQGGEGSVEFNHILEKEEFFGHARLFSHTVIPPGCGIGVHTHVKETEPYYILKGKAEFIDADGSVTVVGPGDVCVIDPGQSHGIRNPFDEPMEMIALIYYDDSER
jgi:quercetin dioxygenase-like cupin family protein